MIGRKLQSEIVWSTLVQVLGKALQIVLGTLTVYQLTTALGADHYGTYAQIMEFSLFFSTAGNLGIFGNIVRKMADQPKDSNLFWNALLLRISTAFVFFGVGILTLLLTSQDPLFLAATLIFMSSLLLDYITSVCDGALQANYRMGRATFALVAGRLLNLACITLLAQQGSSSTLVFLMGPLLGSCVTALLSLYFVHGRMKIIGHWDFQIQKELLWTSLPFGIINILNNIYYRFLPSALIAKTLESSAYSTYSLSLHLASTLSLFSTLLMFSVLPALKHALKEGHEESAKELYKKARNTLTALAILVVSGGILLGPWALSLVTSHDFLSPHLWFMLPLLMILTGVSYFYDLTFITLFALGQDLWWLKREFLALSLSLLIASSILLPLSTDAKVVLILISAIAGESAMALMGLHKTKSLIFHKKVSLSSKIC